MPKLTFGFKQGRTQQQVRALKSDIAARTATPQRVLVIACGALAVELKQITGDLDHVDVECLPAKLHNRPEQIPDAVRQRIRRAKNDDTYDQILVGYMDCGTGGLLDKVCDDESVERLSGSHCYESYMGTSRFLSTHDTDPSIFYLTDYMVRHFDRIIMDGLGITKNPQLAPLYFGNYTKVMYLAQTQNDELTAEARVAAERLGLDFEIMFTGYGQLESEILAITTPGTTTPGTTTPGTTSGTRAGTTSAATASRQITTSRELVSA